MLNPVLTATIFPLSAIITVTTTRTSHHRTYAFFGCLVVSLFNYENVKSSFFLQGNYYKLASVRNTLTLIFPKIT